MSCKFHVLRDAGGDIVSLPTRCHPGNLGSNKKELHTKNTLICKIVALAVAVSLSATSALAGGSDAFSRPHRGTNWVVLTGGSLSISNHELVGTSGSLGYLKGSSKDTAASADVFLGGTDLEYGAVAMGNVAGGNNAFVKIQAANGAGMFDHGAFYTGNDGSGVYFAPSSPVPSLAILDVVFCGTTATMRITSAAGAAVKMRRWAGFPPLRCRMKGTCLS